MTELSPDDAPVAVGGVRLATSAAGVRIAPPPRSIPAGSLGEALAIAGLIEVAGATVEVPPTAVSRSPRRGAAATQPDDRSTSITLTAPPPAAGQGQVLLVEDAGAYRWVLPDARATRGRSRGPATTTFTVRIAAQDADDAPTPVSRGLIGGLIKKVLHVLTFELIDSVAGEVGDFFVRRWEDKSRPHRLRTFTPGDHGSPTAPTLDAAALRQLAGGPALLLIHGTNSLTHSGFGRMSPDVVAGFHDRYRGRVFAFDHPTLSVDPKENCRRLAEMLPADAGLVVDVLAHSRGGLVARVLAERADEVGIDPSCLRVRQTVFVATPNSGTPLADPDHLGSMVDALTNLVDLIPDNPASPLLDSVSGVVAVVKQLAVGAMKGLDGLTSMRPKDKDPKGFLAHLNSPHPVTARYRAIAANYEPPSGSGLARVARDALIDHLFDDAPNDLIVPTLSAYQWNGATGFPIAERVVLPAARGVDHSSFWTAGEAIAAFDAWLRADESVVRATPVSGTSGPRAPFRGLVRADTEEPQPFADVDERLAAGDLDGVRAAVAALPERHRRALEAQVGQFALDSFTRGAKQEKLGRVFVLHGIMGSVLSAHEPGGDSDQIWVNPLRLIKGDFSRLKEPAREKITADGLYRVYLPLIMGLDTTWETVPLPFDWRLGLANAAAGVAERINAFGEPGHLVAHSMGGLVCRMLRAQHPSSWDLLLDKTNPSKGGRLVMLGTPTLGSVSIVTALTAEDKMVRWLARIDLRDDRDEVQQIVASFPGAYQLLPSPDLPAAGSDHARLYDPATWAKGRITPALLDEAKKAHQIMAADGFDAERMLYIAGSGHDTAEKLRVDGPGQFKYQMTRAGDGRVTHASGLAKDAKGNAALTKVWYSTTDHGGLTKDRTVTAAVTDLLRDGSTKLLPTDPPDISRRGPTTLEWVDGGQLEPLPRLDPLPLTNALRGRAPSAAQKTAAAQQYVDEATSTWLGTSPLSDAPPATLHLSVRHASFEHARYLVVLGHYAGSPLRGAEAFADMQLNGRLSTRQVLGRYPSTPNQVLRVVPDGSGNPVGTDGFCGVAVVGLGEMGDLTATSLARAMRNAVLEHALMSVSPLTQHDQSTPINIGVSSVMIGSYGPDGLQLPTVLGALVEGVMLANRELASSKIGPPVRVDELEIVELYGQRAEEAARIIREIERYLPASVKTGAVVRPESRLVVGEGGRPSAPTADYGAGMWRRLIVTGPRRQVGDGRAGLTFTSLGARARADLIPHVVDNRLIGGMVRDAVASARVDDSINVALFELLLPNDLKRELASVENLVLVVDEETADIPWEALADRSGVSGPEPLVSRMGLVRQLLMIERSAGDISPIAPHALVIGDPPGDPRLFPRLDAARREATAVAAQFEGAGIPVEREIFDADATGDGSAAAVIGKLLADDYQILHIAAHGWFEPEGRDGEPWGGVVIGPGQYLTAVEIGQMRRPPSLVFLNCCHLATIGTRLLEGDGSEETSASPVVAFQRRQLPQLAASLARTLMAKGVRAVVAAGWSVDDAAAAEFAEVFYSRMLAGTAFGDAVKAARVAAHARDGGASNTWAAYQCYGDPAFRLTAPGFSTSTTEAPVSAEELVRAVEGLAIRATDPGSDSTAILADVRRLEEAATAPWDTRGDVWAALGCAYGECGALAGAVRAYRAAFACTDGAVPLHAIEQLANLEVRLAATLDSDQPVAVGDEADLAALADRRQPTTAEELRAQAKARIATLLELGPKPTPERLAIKAAFWKELALHTQGGERTAARKTSARTYFEVWKGDGQPYGALNALQLDETGGFLTPTQRKTLLKAIKARDFLGPAKNFWGRVAHADLALTDALIRGSLAKGTTLDEVSAVYTAVFKQRSSVRERNSAIRNSVQLAKLYSNQREAAALDELSQHLAAWKAP